MTAVCSQSYRFLCNATYRTKYLFERSAYSWMQPASLKK